jgi:hypothetical protein
MEGFVERIGDAIAESGTMEETVGEGRPEFGSDVGKVAPEEFGGGLRPGAQEITSGHLEGSGLFRSRRRDEGARVHEQTS